MTAAPSFVPSSNPTSSGVPSLMPSDVPSISSHPSNVPSAVPSTSAEPSPCTLEGEQCTDGDICCVFPSGGTSSLGCAQNLQSCGTGPVPSDQCADNCPGGVCCKTDQPDTVGCFTDNNCNVGATDASTSTSATTGATDASTSTTAAPVLCVVNQYVSSNACVGCPGGSTNDAGDPVLGSDTTCACEANRFVQNNECVSCTGGETNVPGDPVPGPNTSCDRVETIGSSCTIFEGATGGPFSTGCDSGMSTDCCQDGDTCKNGFNGCGTGIASNDACQAETITVGNTDANGYCTGATPQCCKTTTSGAYECRASGVSCP